MNGDEWKKLLRQSCTSASELGEYIKLNGDEQKWFDSADNGLSLLVNPYYLELARTSEAIRKQCIPTSAELLQTAVESDDPLSEDENSPLPRMVHRYKNRVAVLVTDQCGMHCRHCFRRSFTGQGRLPLNREERKDICSYIEKHREVKEVLLTGGDLMTLDDGPLIEMLTAFRGIREDLLLRLATRMPSSLPQRITPYLVEEIAKLGPVWIITQFNHPDELTKESRRALDLLRKGGLPVMNQAVLLKGINDQEEILAELFQGLLVQGVKPYYLFQGDLAAGTSHFRTNLERGWEIMRNLRREISGLAMPVYAVDLPGGGGKIPLSESYLVERSESGFCFQNPEGRSFIYPDE